MKFFFFDVESIGLHGEGFAVAWIVVTEAGEEIAAGFIGCDPSAAKGDDDDLQWVAENVLPHLPELKYKTTRDIREGFWYALQEWKKEGAVIIADCGWPVEARFLAACVDDDPIKRKWEGPYPLHDAASIILAAGGDPIVTRERLPDELPEHDPLADARQTARLVLEAFTAIGM